LKTRIPIFFFNGIGAGHGRKTILTEKVMSMVKARESGNDEVWRASLMDKVFDSHNLLVLIKFLILIICFFEFFNMLLCCSRCV